ncbi:hypothetical protein GCM10009122_22840 [Fulvivirga kasyanovii]|uniref:WGR domain-containing protein n=1 Tax=Fulvivirga kasyanovii TaxID=396812 RepID=A0ABW9RRH4_9BACT|nr:hypothetical protein [Fulvivirga kasyanovii]MTI26306.1 hypothetical protein [Fulvivirga kasyanovii]
MKKAKSHSYQVTIFYATPTGRPSHKSYKVEAEDEKEADSKARKKFRAQKKGKGYRINGGDVYRL